MESEFRDYLRSLHRRDGGHRFQERTVQNRVSNCKHVERYEGDLDQHFDKDQCRDLLQRLSYSTANHDTNNPPDHKIPVDGDIRTGSGTLKSTAKLYAEFRQRQFLKCPQALALCVNGWNPGDGPCRVRIGIQRLFNSEPRDAMALWDAPPIYYWDCQASRERGPECWKNRN